jgi:hypothetical protein
MTMPPLEPAERRGIFVFTDGKSDGAIDASALIKAANDAETSLNFILNHTGPTAPVLVNIAHATGGIVVTETDRAQFLSAPFAILKSGGTARIPIALRRPMLWETAPRVAAILGSASKDIELRASIPLPAADAKQTVQYVFSNYSTAIAGSGITLTAAAVGLIFLGVRKRKNKTRFQTDVEPRAFPVLAILEDLEDGTAYPIQTAVVQIGRDRANDIVLEDQTVSRLHAVLEQGADGSFRIDNRSDVNGTLVNHRVVATSSLQDGDLITMGTCTFRFARVRSAA